MEYMAVAVGWRACCARVRRRHALAPPVNSASLTLHLRKENVCTGMTSCLDASCLRPYPLAPHHPQTRAPHLTFAPTPTPALASPTPQGALSRAPAQALLGLLAGLEPEPLVPEGEWLAIVLSRVGGRGCGCRCRCGCGCGCGCG